MSQMASSLRYSLVMFASLLLGCQNIGPSLPNGGFLHAPYLQIGENSVVKNSLDIVWHVLPDDAKSKWVLKYQTAKGMQTASLRLHDIKAASPAFVEVSATVSDLVPGSNFGYTVSRDGREVFSSTGKAPRYEAKRWRLVSMGDCGRGTKEQNLVAFQMSKVNADLCLITGDIVYDRGTASEYDQKFWSQYNGPETSPEKGASLMRKIPFIPVPGNHDIGSSDLTKYPDGLAYFYNYRVPLNGPDLPSDSPYTPGASGKNLNAFLASAGKNYPRTANYSFDYGNVHFLVLNSNPNVNWADKQLREWVENDLKSARPDFWRIVSYHHPEFQSSPTHADNKQMRALSDLFVKMKVDLVLNGHVHNYQRSKPILESFKSLLSSSLEKNDWPYDRRFDGSTFDATQGVIRIVTGGGGAPLYNMELDKDPSKWLPFTEKYHAVHSFSQIDFDGETLHFKQIDSEGKLVDRFNLKKKAK